MFNMHHRSDAANNGRNCTPGQASAGQYVAATAQVAAMTGEFFSGLGPGNLTFDPNSATSQVMAQSGPVQDVLNSYYMTGQTSGLYTFGGSGYVAAGGNPVAQFVGSFRWSITPGNGGINLSLTNKTSFRSLTYDMGLSGSVALSLLRWEILIRHTTSLLNVNDHETTISVGIANGGALCSGGLSYDAAAVTTQVVAGNYTFVSKDPESRATDHNLNHLVLQSDGTYDLIKGGATKAVSEKKGTWSIVPGKPPNVVLDHAGYPVEIKRNEVRLLIDLDTGVWWVKPR